MNWKHLSRKERGALVQIANRSTLTASDAVLKELFRKGLIDKDSAGDWVLALDGRKVWNTRVSNANRADQSYTRLIESKKAIKETLTRIVKFPNSSVA